MEWKRWNKAQCICFRSKLTLEVHQGRIWGILPKDGFYLLVTQTRCCAMNAGAFWGTGHCSFCKYKSGKECLSRKCWRCYSNANYLGWRVQKCPLGNTHTHTQSKKTWIQIPVLSLLTLTGPWTSQLFQSSVSSLLKDIIFDCLTVHATEMSETETYRFPSTPPCVANAKPHTGNSQTVSVMGGRTQISAWQGIVNLIWN